MSDTQMLKHVLPFLDKHLALGLLSFYQHKGCDVDEAVQTMFHHTSLLPEGGVRPEHEARTQQLIEKVAPALDYFFEQPVDDEVYTYRFKLTSSEVEQLRTQGELSVDYLHDKKITKQMMRDVMNLAFCFYDKGAYGDAAEMLSLCQCVSGSDLPMDSILWGKLVCDSAAAAWQSAVETADKIHENQNSADDEVFRLNKGTTVRARAWLLHCVLFPFFKGGTQYHTKLLFYVFDHKSDYVYRRVVETVCPHYLRYICAAVLLNRTRYNNFREAAAMANSIYEYSDVLTRLVSLIHKCELADAIALLPQVGDLLEEDFFLLDFKEDILENARLLIFQRYMAIHSVVSIPHVAEQLHMTKEDAEVWLVNLISSSKQRAKIDSVNEQLNMVPQSKAVDAVVYDKLENGGNNRR